MFGLGIWEFVIVVIVGLIVLGPRKLPEVARQLGRLMREFRRASNELRHGLDDAVRMDDATGKKTPYDDPARLPKLTELRVDPTQIPEAGQQSSATRPEQAAAEVEPTAAEVEPTDAEVEPTDAKPEQATARVEPTDAKPADSLRKDRDG
jgi:Tat protein translocase TatB subunit